MILDDIVKAKKVELAETKKQFSMKEVEIIAGKVPAPRDFAAALKGSCIKIIAEIKKASPSKGLISAGFNPEQTARAYAENGAAAVSVLTETQYFLGKLAYLDTVKQTLAGHALPVLRKDFLFEPYQIIESRAHQADAVLLIAAVLPPALLKELLDITHGLQMEALVEVHNEKELEIALQSNAGIIGINNRDLATFKVDITTTKKLRQLIPPAITVVSESGIKNRADMDRMRLWGVDAVLIGEALMTAPDIAAKLRELL
jgi:indole-3-glycerol phosphate synthase